MPASSSIIWSSVPSRRLETHPDLPLPVLLCAIRTARRMRLRVDERDRVLKLTHPRGVRPAAALAWALSQKAWVEEQLDRKPPAEPFVPGATIPIEGVETALHWASNLPRTPVLADGRLSCGGPESGFGRRVALFLKRRALATLSADTAEIASTAGVRATSISVGDARSRWGSCSSSGALRYSWRLILAPPEVRRFVVAHEVAHLTHLNHGREFKALERSLFGADTRRAEALLRQWSPRLRRIGLIG
jgi:predicted metal-dependent hydrolase